MNKEIRSQETSSLRCKCVICKKRIKDGELHKCKKFEPQDDKQLYEDTLGIPFDRKPKNHSPDLNIPDKCSQGNHASVTAGTLSSKRLCNYECLKKFDLPFYPEKDIKDFIQKILESTCLRACDICSKNIKTRAGSELI